MSSQSKPLGQLNPGERGTILSINCTGPLRRRLMDMGLTPGTEVIVERTAPWAIRWSFAPGAVGLGCAERKQAPLR